VEGSELQAVIMVPTHDLVVVRLGALQASDYDVNRQRLGRLIASFPHLGVR
jgi:hypothetical protein